MKKLEILFILFCALCCLSSCTPISASQNFAPLGRFSKANGNEEKIVKAQHLHDMGEFEAAISFLKTIVDISPYSFIHDKAYELLITWLLEIRKETEAKRYASYFMSHHKYSPSVNKIALLFNKKASPKSELIKPFDVDASEELSEKASSNSEDFIIELEQLSYLDH